MNLTVEQKATIIVDECRYKIRLGVWGSFITHLHLVPEINIDRAVKNVALYVINEKIIESQFFEPHGSRQEELIQIKKIIEKI
jgi:hypothetical protein